MGKQLVQIEKNRIVRQIPLKKREYTLGRGLENDIVFDSTKVSRLHARLMAEGNSYRVVDEAAKNHVFVNGEQVKNRILNSGDTLNLSSEITLLYLSEKEADEKITPILGRIWETINIKEFLRLKEVTGRIISLDNLDNILNIILAEVINLVNAERGFIALIDENGEIQGDSSTNYNLPLNEDSLQTSAFSHSVVRQAIQKRENIFILNTEDNEQDLSDSVIELELGSVMCSPLLFGLKLVGILYVDSNYQLSDFNEMDQFFFTILADHAAIAIENAKRYNHIQSSNIKLKEEIEESETRYRHLVELSPDAVAVHSEGKIVFVNPAAVKLMGATKPEDLIGKPAIDMVHPDYRDMVRQRIGQQLATNQPVPLIEEKFVRLDGSAIDVEVVAVPLTFRGKPAVQVIARNITERKRMEEQLLRTQKLESVGMLAGGIAHDFNNILQIIQGNALLATGDLENKQNLESCLTAISQATTQASSLTAQLLTFSRGGAPITRATSIETLIEESVTFALRGSNVAYRFDFADDLYFAEADSGQINQVIHNLVINALQAMRHGGTITISASNCEVTPERPVHALNEGPYVKVSVKDQGSGISKENLSKIFDPYFTTKAEGTGLGLASCHSIITKHHGLIEVESTPMQGTTFTFYLPASTDQPRKYKPEKAVKPPPQTRVLLMEDETMVREVAGRMLKKFGCQVTAVPDGVQAIEQYMAAKENDQPFDLVIFDLTIPGAMGGRETLQKLKGYDPTIKAIVASGYSHDPVMANPARYGFQGVIVKPFNLEDLSKAVETVLHTSVEQTSTLSVPPATSTH